MSEQAAIAVRRVGRPSAIRTVEVECNNCGGVRTTRIGSGRDYEYETSDDFYTVVQCTDCGLVYLNPRPEVSALPLIYPQEYLAYNLSEEDERESDKLACKLRRRFYTAKVTHALGFIAGRDENEPIDFLDVGAGDGRLLNWYRSIPDINIRTHGVEMNPAAANRLAQRGHNVYTGLFEEAEIPSESFDIVHSSHVIEHVADPMRFATKGRDLLRPGGIFLVETPNLDCVGARLFRRRYWGGYHFPRHWTFYTPETLTEALHQAGLKVLEIQFYPNPVFWVWTMHHVLKDNGFPEFVWNQFPAVDIFKNSFGNVVRLGIFTVLERCLGFVSGGRMGTMQAIAVRSE
ncbi:MAG: class I SAM-dependent methyltransferase [Candidatus Tectomicrobia bacterium]|nr:class I SAM-dependent methyltransferase [Candidatus Tectomicrobia bacterium]